MKTLAFSRPVSQGAAWRGAACVVALAGAAVLGLAGPAPAAGPALTGTAAFGDWRVDKPGVRRLLTPGDLPPISQPTYGVVEVVPAPAGAQPLVPDGFAIERVASGLATPRVIRVAPNGDLFVAESGANAVRVYRVPPGSSQAREEGVFAAGLHRPFGIAFHPPGPDPRWVYVANSNSIVRFPYRGGDLKAAGPAETVVACIPWTHHWTRDIAFAPDGSRLYLAIGSGSNVALDMFAAPRVRGGIGEWAQTRPLGAAWDTEEGRAVVLSFDPEGGDQKTVATGLRNCSGLTVQPATGRLWCAVNERDELGDDTPFEYVTRVAEGAFYGWPWYYIGANEDPRHKNARPDLRDKVTVPDVLMQAHSAPLQIVFYDGTGFPAEYRGDAFVALHGSWNRQKRTGYKVVRVIIDDQGAPTGEYEDFLTGFVLSDVQAWGRPVGLAVAKDGSLFVTEDGNGTIWRIFARERPAR